MSNLPFADPAIMLATAAPAENTSKNTPGGKYPAHVADQSLYSRLEPGSALSKLLDSAMANAAKELTPESEARADAVSPAPAHRVSILEFVLQKKTNAYSIEFLLSLRSSAAVAQFDLLQLPDASFWALKLGRPAKNTEKESRNGAGGRKSRRNNNTSNQGVNAALWERQPNGFVKNSELDTMLAEKISQLLGETPDEAEPEWDTHDLKDDLKMEMGLTVEDFERWKRNMRQEERKKHGLDLADAGSTNEVDSFFSFVREDTGPKADARTNVKAAEAKSSRFLSFFGEEPKTKAASTSSLSSTKSEGLRFFTGSSDSPGPQNLQMGRNLLPPVPQAPFGLQNGPPGLQKGPPGLQKGPPGLQNGPSLQNGLQNTPSQKGPPPGLQSTPAGLPNAPPGLHSSPIQNAPPGNMPQGPQSRLNEPQPNGPPGLHHPNMPPGFQGPNTPQGRFQPPGLVQNTHPPLPGMAGPTNDTFFLSLLNKRQDGQNSPTQGPPNLQAGSGPQGQMSPGMLRMQAGQPRETFKEKQGAPGAPGMGPGMSPGMAPGMPQQFYPYPPPPGMFPPGMVPPGVRQGQMPMGQNGPQGQPIQGYPPFYGYQPGMRQDFPPQHVPQQK